MAAPDPRRVTIPVTMACPVCRSPFPSSGRRTFCTDACRAAAHRRRRAAARPPLSIPAATHRKPLTVYACDACGARALGEQQCPDCSRFMGRVGLGGACPSCDEPITVAELTGLEVGP